jgi:hypothetical protein
VLICCKNPVEVLITSVGPAQVIHIPSNEQGLDQKAHHKKLAGRKQPQQYRHKLGGEKIEADAKQ